MFAHSVVVSSYILHVPQSVDGCSLPFLLSSLVYMLTRPRLFACRTATENPRAFQTLKLGFVLCFSAATKWRRFILRRAVLCPRAVSGVESTAASQRGLELHFKQQQPQQQAKERRRNALLPVERVLL